MIYIILGFIILKLVVLLIFVFLFIRGRWFFLRERVDILGGVGNLFF